MKLICEMLQTPISVIKEAREDGKRNVFIEGVFLMGEEKNRNGRVYRMPVLEKAVNAYNQKYINENRSYGELNHPAGPTINLDRVSHMIKSLYRENNNYIGKAMITNTPMGDIVKGLLEDGANLGVSSRGMGTIKERNGIMEVQDDFMLATAADIVADPSAPNAFVRGVMENVDWVYNAADGSWLAQQALEDQRKALNKMTKEEINNSKLKFFEKFLDIVSNKSFL